MISYEEILVEFQKQKVKYIIVGGMAVNYHGYSRNTSDMDLLVDMTDANLKKIVTILKKQGYRVKQPVDPMGIADKETRYDWIHNKNMKAFNFYKENELKEVDIIIESPVSYQEAKKKVFKLKVGSFILPVISIDHLVKMKAFAGRPLDKNDIESLKVVKKYEK